MAKDKNKNTTKSFVMLIVTGVVLVAVTLCWFAINKNSGVEYLDSEVGNNASAKATLYIGKTADGEVAITSDENNKKCVKKYEPSENAGDAIVLENMVPGAEYFFKVELKNCNGMYDVVLSLNDIVDKGLGDGITVYSRLTTSGDAVIHPNSMNPKALKAGNFVEDEINCTTKTNYVIYFSFKFSDEATIGGTNGNGAALKDYRNKSVEIGKWDTAISRSVAETTSSTIETTSSVTE